MAPSAYIELGLACDLFEKGARYSRRARSGMVRSLFYLIAPRVTFGR